MVIRFWMLLLALTGLSCGRAGAQDHLESSQRFTVVAFHDVVDQASELDYDAVTTDRLISFFDHLRGDGWNPVSLQEISDARLGKKPLPPKPILITFDDGYRSLYTRVFPLLMAYRIPVVAALVGHWMVQPRDSWVPYGSRLIPRDHFIDWDQAREMQATGLVEFASHTFNQHRELQSTPQGNVKPALATLAYDAETAHYETIKEYQQRFKHDLLANESLMWRELGKKPRAVVWPYGRYNQIAVEELKKAGYEFALTLDYEPGHLQRPFSVGRYWPTGNLRTADLVNDLEFTDVLPRARRMVRIDPGQWWSGDLNSFEQHLGDAIERLRAHAITDVVINGLHRDHDTGHWSAWFPTSTLPIRADVLSRIAWQLRKRAGVRTSVDLSFQEMSNYLSEFEFRKMHQDLGWHVIADGLWMHLSPVTTKTSSNVQEVSKRWADVQGVARKSSLAGQLREMRQQAAAQGLERLEWLALEAFREVQKIRPELHWVMLTDFNDPSPLAKWADLVMVDVNSSSVDAPGATRHLLSVANVNDPWTRRRTGIWLETTRPLSDAKRLRIRQQLLAEGLAVLGGQFLSD